ncbi:MAG: leucine-rich repeat domain-containing protein [Paludibacteraceae bacterium]|nr:leucine-rich repeat domain-containing protein [Paludibacteraceae bacterium]
MKKSLITSVAALAVGLFAFAETGMYVKLKNGETFRHNVDDVEEVVFAEIQEQNPIFKFTKLTNNTASVGVAPGMTPAGPPITIPSEAEIDGKIYKVTHIEALGFSDCQVSNIVIPSSVTSIGDSAFHHCQILIKINIPSNVTSIGNGVFAGCSALGDITIPSSVTNIGDNAFRNCSSLDLVINNTERNVTVGRNAFEGCKSVTWEIPDKESTGLQFEVSGTTAMVVKGDYSKLDSAFIPSKVKIDGSVYTVTGIANNAFSNYKNLTYVNVSEGVTNMGIATFSYCENLETVVLGEGIKKISSSLFNGCANLWDINIPASVTEIDGSAFEGCASLASIDIPANVTNIVEYAFYGCKNLASINVDDKNTTYASVDGVLYNKEKTILIQAPGKIQGKFTIPSGVTNIASGAFGSCEGLTGVEIPNTVTSISEFAFENCTGLTNLTIPSSVKYIDWKAFKGCENLDVVIRNAEEDVTVGSGALDDCKSVTWKIIDESESPLKFKILTDSTAEVTKENCVEGSVAIPSKVVIDGKTYSVVSIATYAFKNCKGLTNITIPSSVVSIGDYAFQYCKGLTNITIPTSVVKIGTDAFANSGLTTIELPSSITSIGFGLFLGCSDLVSVKIPSSVESIGESAFVDCTSLTNLELSSSVKSIGVMAFYNCKNLDLVIDNSEDNVEVAVQAFQDCKSVTWKK